MNVTLRYFEGCPHWPTAHDRLREALRAEGMADVEPVLERVETAEDAELLSAIPTEATRSAASRAVSPASPASAATSARATGRPDRSWRNAALRMASVASGMVPRTSSQQVSGSSTSNDPPTLSRSRERRRDQRQRMLAADVGIALATVSLIVMPVLGVMKGRVGRAMDSPTLVADSTEMLLCSYLSAILLAGLVLNATVGWWWADPLAAIGIAALAVREGLEAWTGERDH
jgi:hypothetical protein